MQPPHGRPVYLLHPSEVAADIPPEAAACYEQLHAEFALQTRTAHTLAPDPAEAEIILAPIAPSGYGPCFEKLRRSAIYRRHADKLVVYSPQDNQFPALRGLFPSVGGRWVRSRWALPAHYISSHIHQFKFRPEEMAGKDLLFSFVGSSRTHPIREQIVQWREPRGVVVDASARTDEAYWWEKKNREQLVAGYREITLRSQFVLCPRGVSASSIRLFEAMEAGAIPVIVADDLQLPLGPRWEEFSLRVPERDVATIPQLLERWEHRAAAMGAAARDAWEMYFSPGATVGSMIGWAGLLLGNFPRRPARICLGEYGDPRRLKSKLRRVLARA